jgi:Gpi18-like mannosyltransferase
MRTQKSVPPDDKVVPSTDNTVLPLNETQFPIEMPANEVVSSSDETVLSSDDALLSNAETTTPIDDVVPSNAETTVSIDDAVSPLDDTLLPGAETAASPDERVAPTSETPLSTEPTETWRALVTPWWKATLAVLPTFLITRFIFLLLSYFGGVLFFVKNYVTTVIPFHDMLYRWYYWDAKRFATIATSGYTTPDFAAFFPLYPTIVHVIMVLTHRDVLEVSMFVSNVAFLGVLIVLYRFVTTEFDKDTAQRTVLYISIFPTALFFFAGYNESLFLFFTLLCFYTVRRRAWWLAGLFGFLATLTRSSGLFLAPVFVCEYLRLNWPLLRDVWQRKELARMVRPLANLSAVLLIPLAICIYALGLYRHYSNLHDPLLFLHAQSNWRQGLTFPLYAPLATLKKIVTLPLFTFVTPHNIIDLSAAVLFVVLLVMCFVGPYRIERSQWTFPLFGLLILVTTMLYPTLPSKGGMYDPLASTQRLVLEAFVGFIILARLGRRPWFHQLYLLISLPLLAFLTLQFMTGHWTV